MGGTIVNKTSACRTTVLNVQRLVEYLAEHEPCTVQTVVRSGLMTSPEAHAAIQYGINHGVIAWEKHSAAPPEERIQYRLTGQPLIRNNTRPLSFDALLEAWGIPRTPPEPAAWPAGQRVIFVS